MNESEHRQWKGIVLSVQPRIRLSRSFDQQAHSYLGFVLRVRGLMDGKEGEFLIAVGKAAHEKHRFHVGDEVSGAGIPVEDSRLEIADLYKASALKVVARAGDSGQRPPPYLGTPPNLEVYRSRGHRRLAVRTYVTKCISCIWGCEMAVEMIIDQWNPALRRYRRETFCYGPKSCRFYAAGPTRKVPGRKGMSWEEPEWVDEEATAHRGPDE
jgi:hypothetical protein